MKDFQTKLKKYQANLSDQYASLLLAELGPRITLVALHRLGVGCNESGSVFCFPERGADRNVTGLLTRSLQTGDKRTVKGSKRGLLVPDVFADSDELLILTEGPTDTAAMISAGFDAVGRPSATGGCKLASQFVGNYLDREILVIADQDGGVGEKGARKVAKQIVDDWSVTVTVVSCPNGHKDPRDWLNENPNLSKAEIEAQLRENVLEVFEPAGNLENEDDVEAFESSDDDDSIVVISNFRIDQSGEKSKRVGLMADEILQQVQVLLHDSLKSLKGESLFVMTGEGTLREVGNHDELMAFLDQVAKVDWGIGSDMVTAKRFYLFCRQNCEKFETIETFPHVPKVDGSFYACPEVDSAVTGRLDELVNMLNPLTDHDRALIKAMFMTVVWGGPPGSRPIFVITGPPKDPKNGVGVGKSKLAEIVSQLVGGIMSFTSNDSLDRIMGRLLSPGAIGKRVALLDNVKSHKFSWAEFEGLVTAPVLSGHRLYAGEGQRPNLLTWIVTVNGASTSRDIAERAVVVKLARPAYQPNWQTKVSGFIENHRWEIFADIKNLIEQS